MKLEPRSTTAQRPGRRSPFGARPPASPTPPRQHTFERSAFEEPRLTASGRARLGLDVHPVDPRPQVAALDLARHMPPARPVGLTGPTRIDAFTMRGVRLPADRYEVDLGDRRVPVVVGQGAVEEGMVQPRLEDVARALSRLPPEALPGIREIHIAPFRNPEDEYWARERNQPGFRSDMTNGAQGIVTLYPRTTHARDDFMAATLLHESAHALSHREWGHDHTSRQWAPWRTAAAADGQAPSDYATQTPGEDYAESMAVYLATRGTPAHDAYRQQFPNRFAILDTRFGGQP